MNKNQAVDLEAQALPICHNIHLAHPLGFLQGALLDVSTTRLRRALLDAEKENIDVWDTVDSILTQKSILKMGGIYFDGLEAEGGVLFLGGIGFSRETVKSKKKSSTKAGKGGFSRNRTKSL